MIESRSRPWRIYLWKIILRAWGSAVMPFRVAFTGFKHLWTVQPRCENMEERPSDFVPLDLEMAGMSGTEVLREVLETDLFSDDTVIVMSAHPSEEVGDEPVRLRLLREALSDLKLRQ